MDEKTLKRGEAGLTAEEHELITFLAERADEGELTAEGRTEYRRLIQRMHTSAMSTIEATPEDRRAAWGRLQQIQQKVGESLAEQGVTEDDIIRAVVEDD